MIEPFLPHQQSEEFYVCIYSHTESQDVVLFHHEGGVDVGDVDNKVQPAHIVELYTLRGQSGMKKYFRNIATENLFDKADSAEKR